MLKTIFLGVVVLFSGVDAAEDWPLEPDVPAVTLEIPGIGRALLSKTDTGFSLFLSEGGRVIYTCEAASAMDHPSEQVRKIEFYPSMALDKKATFVKISTGEITRKTDDEVGLVPANFEHWFDLKVIVDAMNQLTAASGPR